MKTNIEIVKSAFPIVDGKKIYQDFKDEHRPATLENLNETIAVLGYMESELTKRIGYFQSEKRRMCKCLHLLTEENKQEKN
jgi:hypothetical protein